MLKLTFFRRQKDPKLEDRLRGLSGEPNEDFVRNLSTEVRANRLRTTMRSRRVVAAAVTTGLMLIPFAAFGGVGLAAQAAKTAAQSVGTTGNDNSGNSNKGNENSGDTIKVSDNAGDNNNGNKPDDDQYKPGKGCGDKNHEHSREDECKKPAN